MPRLTGAVDDVSSRRLRSPVSRANGEAVRCRSAVAAMHDSPASVASSTSTSSLAPVSRGTEGSRRGVAAVAALALLAVALLAFAQAPATASKPFRFGAYQTTLSDLALPCGAAIDQDGTVFVVDAGEHKIAVFARNGQRLRTFGSLGDDAGQLRSPSGVALGPDNLIYVSDSGNHRVQVFDRAGRFVRQWGARGVEAGRFCSPQAIVVDDERVYVADTGNHRVQTFKTDGTFIASFGEFGRGDGQFIRPVDLTIDDDRRVFVVDSDNNRVQCFDRDGTFIRGWGDFGPFPGLLNDPYGVTRFAGQIFITDTANHRVQVFDDRGEMQRQWGIHDPMAHEGNGKIHYPRDVAIGGPPDGTFAVICEPNEHRCQIFRAAGPDENEQPRAGIAPGEQTHFGQRLAINGRLMLIPEPENHFIYVFDLKEEAAIIISQFGQRGTKFGQFIHPTGLLVSERDRQALAADVSTARLQTFALDFGPDEPVNFVPFLAKFVRAIDFTHRRFAKPHAAMLWPLLPEAIRRDAQGHLHVLDQRNAMTLVFDEQMSFVRSYGSYGDGAGQLREPADLACSPDGSIAYVVDAGNFRVQAFDHSGTPAMSFGSFGDDDGRFRQPFGIAVDRDGFIYVSDALRDCIQKFDQQGRFIAKWGTRGINHGEFWRPMGMAIDDRQRLIVIDHGNHRAQMFSLSGEWLGTFGAGKVSLKSQMPD